MASLLALLRAQEQLQHHYGYKFEEMTVEERITFIKEQAIALTDEVHEALGEIKWKSWTAGDPYINETSYLNELTDALHFLMNMMLATGHGADALSSMMATRYFEKNSRNHKRADDGYDGVTGKCPKCRRDLNDPGVTCELTIDGYQCQDDMPPYPT